ncbi:hypothetical protein QQ045_003403 [Rhodiola kirilowii]
MTGANQEVVGVTVEDEDDVAKFKDYTPQKSADASALAVEQPSAPAPSKKEEIKESKSLSPAKAPAHIVVPPTGDCIFTSPLARKLAEENNVRIINSIHCIKIKYLSQARIVKLDVEEYLASRGKEAAASTPKTKNAPAGAISGLNYTDIQGTLIRNVSTKEADVLLSEVCLQLICNDTEKDKLEYQSYSSQVQPVRGLSSGAYVSSNFILKGNIARWVNKKGEKVYPGEVLCEVEMDIAISVEDEDEDEAEIANFKGYTPKKSAHASAPAAE